MQYKLSKLSAGLAEIHLAELGIGNGAEKPAQKPTQFERTGFRDAVRAVLRDSPGKGLKPKDIAHEMLTRGFKYTASTELSTRVSNDLRRLIKSKKVRKHRGHYYIEQEAINGAN